ncbi:immunogenic MPB70 domain protein [Mycolicibacterium hassiacum DSM 44199]|uniref:Immunogenic MPB70 domain protein n=1 Tax=Mycolicibacterium hassiacum (strain DSM 44199 / CIP 105218 / JCM 12690 / 3849) TaxID=1122247 RepID=K5BE84_MYCHD|nr:fasciclin domain-containing protein [Mycolicibacterium hassiacum]EKF22752.1 immunogenic MPB70 domain protein [Mycolicibacterium hassiacum DSM 44199]MBX5488155.1 fasciclin domain-containing protein [Mycolicibacterium hassiacum]MDA4084213.1 fasciclin [Mycolicibacterium hassiacum DSM 44199]PZN25387.1 MAG: fasciclin domain-containing protein [Mycolicibacterium hassiacum]VCT91222.1 Immunogenic protein MPB70 [Mycolicibacterium hassiacum DSM 44199]
MRIRTTKAIGVAAGAAAIALSLPFAGAGHAEPANTGPLPAEIPDPQGPGCDAFKTAVPNWKYLSTLPVGTALQKIPDASTFYSAISGGFNPEVNIVPVLENGPYVVFAPTNEAFAELGPQLDALKADPRALMDLAYYHEFLGILGPDDVKGQRPTQQGADIKVTGSGGDIKVNDTAKVVCGGIWAKDARIYLIDTVLDPSAAPKPLSSSTSQALAENASSSSALAAEAETDEEEPIPAADAPIG